MMPLLKHLPELLTCIRLGFVSRRWFEDRVAKHPYMAADGDYLKLITKQFDELNEIKVKRKIGNCVVRGGRGRK
jgi:hypothetical protein